MVRSEHSSRSRYRTAAFDDEEGEREVRQGHKAFVLLSKLDLSYPGWNMDFQNAMKAYTEGSNGRFELAYQKLKEKQMIYDDTRSLKRLNALVQVRLSYPGHENDLEDLEEWHLKNKPSERNEETFQDMLNGLRNKQQLFVGDRTHPNIVELDNLDLSYPDWELDYQTAFRAHTGSPVALFPKALHRLREKQRVFVGDRSHWRLKELHSLILTYPGWQSDVVEIEEWHFENEETMSNGQMFHEALEGMKEQEQIYVGVDYCPSDDSSLSSGPSTKMKVLPRENIKQVYNNITESLKEHQQRREKMIEQRSKCSADTWTEPDNRDFRPTQHFSDYEGREGPPTSHHNSSSSRRDRSPYHHDNFSSSRHDRSLHHSHEVSSHRERSPYHSNNVSSRRERSPYHSNNASSRRDRSTLHHDNRSSRRDRSSIHYEEHSLQLDTSSLLEDTDSSYRDGSSHQYHTETSYSITSSIVDPCDTSVSSIPKANIGKCVVCRRRPMTHVFVPCGHLCTCTTCSDNILSKNGACPICKKFADETHRVLLP